MMVGLWRHGWRAPRFAGVRARVAGLVAAAVLPLVLLAVVLICQTYSMSMDAARQRAQALASAVAARDREIGAEAVRFVSALAAAPAFAAGGAAACSAGLAPALALAPAAVAELTVLDGAGQPRCAPARRAVSGEPAAGIDARAVAATLGQGNDPTVLTAAGGAGPPAIVAAARQPGPDGPATGAVLAVLPAMELAVPANGSAKPLLAWLIAADNQVLPLGKTPAAALPAGFAPRQHAAESPEAFLGRAGDGRVFSYAIAPLGGELRLLLASPAAADLRDARAGLWRDLAWLAALLGAGLAAAALGARFALLMPIEHLSRAVQAWRRGARFDPGLQRGVPLELRQLATSFTAATAALAEREQQLQSAAEQQELLMQEIHHRVKNNLQIVASLLNLQASRIRLPAVQREFASARDRIRALATLHRHLYLHGDVDTINMPSFLRELCDQLLAALGETAGGRIRLEIEAPALQISSDQAVPMALIVTEAVSNAAKYAFPGGRAGHIRVALTTEGQQARLVIQDDGVGIPAGPAQTETGMRDGIGLHLIRGFARQLGGQLSVTHDGGTRYELNLALRRERAAEDAAEALG
jgi:two-component sensor histidine kinase